MTQKLHEVKGMPGIFVEDRRKHTVAQIGIGAVCGRCGGFYAGRWLEGVKDEAAFRREHSGSDCVISREITLGCTCPPREELTPDLREALRLLRVLGLEYWGSGSPEYESAQDLLERYPEAGEEQ